MPSYKRTDNEFEGGTNRYATCFTGRFRVDIRKAAFLVSFFGCALSLAQVVFALLPDSPTHLRSIPLFLASLFGAMLYLSISVALCARNRLILLPYLFYQGLYLVLCLVGSICFTVMTISTPQWAIDAWNKQHPPEAALTIEQFRVLMCYFAKLLLFCLMWGGCFCSIILRAYKHMAHIHNIGVGVRQPLLLVM